MLASKEMEPLRRVSRRRPCPVCGHEDWCGFNSRVCVCMRVESPRPAANGGWVHRLTGVLPAPAQEPDTMPSTLATASVDTRHEVYSALLAACSLREEHREDLRRRGLSDTQIRYGCYASVPGEPWRVALELLRRGYDLRGVPGFYLHRTFRSCYWTFRGSPGYFIPVRDYRGRIVALQVRADRPLNRKRYRMFSSGQRPSGACSGTPVHVARPPVETGDWGVLVTEGALKADIAAGFLSCVVLGLAGVSTWREALPALESVRTTHDVVLAFDNDRFDRRKPAVGRAARELREALQEQGIEVYEAVWSPAYKGIDDALAAGEEIRKKRV
ncbi:MAG: DUF3854 domain-containing protein [Bacillota bacterium]|nr:DUF3854 domain-containing protein [Bacillota bacterium]